MTAVARRTVLSVLACAAVALGLAGSAAAADGVDASLKRAVASKKILVAGATGRNGSAILAALEAAGAKPRAMARDVEKAREKYGADHDWVAGDVTQPATLDAALKGVEVVISAVATSQLEGPNGVEAVDLEGTRNLLAAMKRAGAKRIVYITGMSVKNPPPTMPPPMARAFGLKREAEKAVIASGLEYVLLRPTGILNRPAGQNEIRIVASGDYRPGADELMMKPPAGASMRTDAPPVGTISRADLARVAMASAVDPAATNRAFVVTQGEGPATDAWRRLIGTMPAD